MRRRHALHRLHARHRGTPRPASRRHGCEVHARARAAHPARKRGILHQARRDERRISLQAPHARQERRPAREGCRIERALRAHTGGSVREIKRLAKPATHSQPHARAAIESRTPSALGNGGRRVSPPDKIDPLNNETPHRCRYSASSIPLVDAAGAAPTRSRRGPSSLPGTRHTPPSPRLRPPQARRRTVGRLRRTPPPQG